MPKPEDLTPEQLDEAMEAFQLATGAISDDPDDKILKQIESAIAYLKSINAEALESTDQLMAWIEVNAEQMKTVDNMMGQKSDDQILDQVQRTAAAMRKQRPRPPAAPPAPPARKHKTRFIRVTSAVKIPEIPLFAWINPEHIIDMAEYESESTGVFTKIRTTGKSVDVLEKPEDIIEMINKQ